MRIIKICLQSLFGAFNLDQHFFMLPGLVEDPKNTNVLSNVQNQLVLCHGSSSFKKFNEHVSLVVLRNHDLVFLRIFVYNES